MLTGRPQSHPPTSQTLLGSAAECQGRRERGKQPARNHLRGRFGEACPRSESVLRAPQLLPASRTTDRELSRRNEGFFFFFWKKNSRLTPMAARGLRMAAARGWGRMLLATRSAPAAANSRTLSAAAEQVWLLAPGDCSFSPCRYGGKRHQPHALPLLQ